MTRPRKIRLLLAALGVGVGVAAWVAWPRGPRLEWYKSPVIRINGERVRYKVLVPSGWVATNPTIIDDEEVAEAYHFPPSRSPWLEALVGNPGRHWNRLTVTFTEALKGHPQQVQVYKTEVTHDSPLFVAHAKWQRLGRERHSGIRYEVDDRQALHATYRQICESFQVIRQP